MIAFTSNPANPGRVRLRVSWDAGETWINGPQSAQSGLPLGAVALGNLVELIYQVPGQPQGNSTPKRALWRIDPDQQIFTLVDESELSPLGVNYKVEFAVQSNGFPAMVLESFPEIVYWPASAAPGGFSDGWDWNPSEQVAVFDSGHDHSDIDLAIDPGGVAHVIGSQRDNSDHHSIIYKESA